MQPRLSTALLDLGAADAAPTADPPHIAAHRRPEGHCRGDVAPGEGTVPAGMDLRGAYMPLWKAERWLDDLAPHAHEVATARAQAWVLAGGAHLILA